MIQNQIVTVIGHKGYGKTKLTELLALLKRRPTIIADPRYQYEPKPWRVHFGSVEQFRKWIHDRDNIATFYEYKFELVVQGVDPDSFEVLAWIVMKMKAITFLVDEVDMFAPPTMNNKKAFYHLIHYGRHNRIDIITTSRRPPNISRNLTAMTDLFFFSKIRENTDKKYMENYIGKEHAETAKRLERFHFLMIGEDLEKAQIISIPRKAAEAI
ncbi:hypothetical protein WCX49_06665 [Sulfurimonas sp. HSL-1656]|uniref:hypothetical protein n=1 Tax=Thiomicrolovo subterrani TaxID=3131934 RepID=UPI0031F7F587